MAKQERKSGEPLIPPFSLAAAAFAALLVVTQIDNPDADQKTAVGLFAVSIPMHIGAAVFQQEVKKIPQRIYWDYLGLLAALIGITADLLSVRGLYFLIHHVDGGHAMGFVIATCSLIALVGAVQVCELVSAIRGKPRGRPI